MSAFARLPEPPASLRGELLVGSSAAITRARDLIARVAPTDVTVLLSGESGTGKELAARALHAQSHRASRAFVPVSCAALPADLLESALFGAAESRGGDGLFAAASGGTLFLDDVGDASPAVQTKLLRVLQDRRYTRVGSHVECESDVRIVAATSRDLRADVAEGRFRSDLLFRLHVLPIRMPPLRDRGEDIPLLAERLLARAAARHNRPAPRLNAAAVDALMRHAWPGNVRELANVLEAALLLGDGGELRAEHLRALMLASRREPEAGVQLLPTHEDADWPTLRSVRDRVERTYLEQVLRRTNGNVTAAAKLAGRTRSDFYELLRRHGLTSAAFKAAP